MQLSQHSTTFRVVSLLSLLTIGVAASALTNHSFLQQSHFLRTLAVPLKAIVPFTAGKSLPAFFAAAPAIPSLQAAATPAPLEIEYKVEQVSLVQISGNSTNTTNLFRLGSGKISITGNETVRPLLGTFNAGSFSSQNNALYLYELKVKLSFPGIPVVEPVEITAQLSYIASGGIGRPSTNVISITPNKIVIPQAGEFELFQGEPVFPFNPSDLELSLKWTKGVNGCTFPTVTDAPKNITVCESSPASFSVAATGNGTLRYQWRRNGVTIPGATNSTLTLAAVSASDVGTYEALIADDCGPMRSATAFLSVNRPGEYSIRDRIVASDAIRNGSFGLFTANSGNTLVTTGYTTDRFTKAYVFTRTGESWTQEAILKPSDTTNSGFFFSTVAIDNNTIAVIEDRNVYLFVRSGSTWTQQAKLNTSERIFSYALQGDTLAIGQALVPSGLSTTVGRVLIYQRTGSSWNLQATLNPTEVESYLYFGYSLALSGNTLAVHATNQGAAQSTPPFAVIKEAGLSSVSVFERNGSTWSLKNKLSGKVKRDGFGDAFVLRDNWLAISAAREEISTGKFGALYLYQNQGSGWAEQQRLETSSGVVSINQTQLLARTSDRYFLYARTAQGIDPTPKILSFPEFSSFGGRLTDDSIIFGVSNYNAGVNLEGAGAVFVTKLAPCGANLAVITSHPQNQQVADQLPAGFRIAFEQSSAITGLQWQISTDGGATYTDIAGATRAELSIAPDSPLYKNGNRFRVIIISTGGRITSDAATLTITPTLSGFTTTSNNNLPVAVNLGSNTSIVFNNVTQSGMTTVKAIPLSGITLPGGATPPAGSLAFDITTTATFTGPVTLTFNVPTVNDPTAFAQLRVYHGEGAPVQFVDRTVLPPDAPAPNYVARQISARVTTLSPFVIVPVTETVSGCTTVNLAAPVKIADVDFTGVRTGTGIEISKVDFNGDGLLDFAIYNLLAKNLFIYMNNGRATFTPTLLQDNLDQPDFYLTDINSDGLTDILVGVKTGTSTRLDFYSGQRNGLPIKTIASSTVTSRVSFDFEMKDVVGNSTPELVSSSHVLVLFTSNLGSFYKPYTLPFVSCFNSLNQACKYRTLVADFNSDGHPDIANATAKGLITGQLAQGTIAVDIYFGKEDGTYTSAVSYALGSAQFDPSSNPLASLQFTEFNGDSKRDLALEAVFSGGNEVRLVFLPGNGNGSFGSPLSQSYSPNTIGFRRFSDFNGDGKMDFAGRDSERVGANLVSSLSVFLAGNNFTFTRTPLVTSSRLSPEWGWGDFNNDGKLDVITRSDQNRTAWFKGNANGTFSPGVPLPVDLWFFEERDLNRDGKLDLLGQIEVITNGVSTYFGALLVGNGDGTFREVYRASSSNVSVTGADFEDFDGDGIADYGIRRDFSKYDVVRTLADGSFSSPVSVNFGTGVNINTALQEFIVRDIDQDGRADFVYLKSDPITRAGEVLFLKNICGTTPPTGNTRTGSNVTVTSNSTTVTFSNVTTAGNTTITPIDPTVVGTLPNGYVLVNGSLAFEITTTAVFSGPITITFNVPDVTDATVFSTLRVLHGEGTPQALVDRTVLFPDTPAPNFATKQISARVTSLSPFVIASLSATPPTGCAVTSLQSPTNYATADTPSAIAHGDFNGDGKSDVVTANYEANAISVLLNNGNGGFNPAVNYNAGSNPKAVAVGDLNGDNNLDVVVANLTSFDLSVFLGNGDGTFTAAPRVTGMSYPTSVAIGDLDSDGKADLVVANSGSFLTTVVYGNGDGTFRFGFEHFNFDGGMPYAVTMSDFNKDGRRDFAVAFNTKDAIGVYLNLPTGFTTNIQMFPAGDQPIAIAAGDFNGDGTDDVAVANYGSNNVTAVTGLSTVTTIAVGSLPETLAMADLNGDTKKDLIVGNAGTNFVSLLTATSEGQFTRQDVAGVESPSAVAATDFNGDGKVDVMVADYWVNRVTTYQGACGTTSALEAASNLRTLRYVRSKYDGYPHARSGNGRRSDTTRPRQR